MNLFIKLEPIRFANPFHLILETPQQTAAVLQQLNSIQMQLSDLDAKLSEIRTSLDEAAQEIVVEIEKLKNNNPALSGDAVAQLEAIQARARQLADIVPQGPIVEPTPEEPAPPTEPEEVEEPKSEV